MTTPVLLVEQLRIGESEARQRISDNLTSVRQSVEEIACASGRRGEDIRVVGVTKYVDPTITSWLVDAGCFELGENRPQTLLEKSMLIHDDRVRWHQIGHLQRNKVRKLIGCCGPLIHSVDSMRLLEEVHAASIQQKRSLELLLEVNVGGEDSKTGLSPIQLPDLIREWHALNVANPGNCKVTGLMAMAPMACDGAAARPFFAALRRLRDDLIHQFEIDLPELSMGMSGDYAAAIEEGSTMIRIGSSLFRGLL